MGSQEGGLTLLHLFGLSRGLNDIRDRPYFSQLALTLTSFYPLDRPKRCKGCQSISAQKIKEFLDALSKKSSIFSPTLTS